MQWMTPGQAAPLALRGRVRTGDPARTGRIAFWDPAGGTRPQFRAASTGRRTS